MSLLGHICSVTSCIVCTGACMCVCIWVCVYIYVCIYIHTRSHQMSGCTYVHIYTHIYTHTPMCVYIYIRAAIKCLIILRIRRGQHNDTTFHIIVAPVVRGGGLGSRPIFQKCNEPYMYVHSRVRRGGGLGSRPIFKKFHETYAPS